MNPAAPGLTDILDKRCLQKLQDAFTSVSGLSLALVDASGNALTRPGRPDTCCCGLPRGPEKDPSHCRAHVKAALERARQDQEPRVGACPHTGRHFIMAPIMMGGVLLGCWTAALAPRGAAPGGGSAGAAAEPPRKDDLAPFIPALQELADAVAMLVKQTFALAAKERQARGAIEQLEVRDTFLTNLLNACRDAMYICDFYTGDILMTNEGYSRQIGKSEGELIGKKCWNVNGPSELSFCPFCPRDRLLDEHRRPAEACTREFYNEKLQLWLRCTHRALIWSGERLAHMVTQQDITQEHAFLEQLEHLAYYDRRTELPNSQALARAIKETWNRKGEPERHLICFDLSSLQLFIDAYGRENGDNMLRTIIAWLRSEDFGDSSLYHLYGYRFCLVLRGQGEAASLPAAERIRGRFEKPWTVGINGHALSYICDTAVSILRLPFHSIANADEAMALVRRTLDHARRNKGIFVYDDETDRAARERIQLNMHLKTCVELGMHGFSICFHPIVAVDSGLWKGLEALCRWSRPGFGPVPPTLFIREAERLGLISLIGDWMLEHAVRHCKELGLDQLSGFFLSVNVSPAQMMDEDFANRVAAVLARHSFPGSKLNLEVTESAEMSFSTFTLSVINKLRGLGVSLALDDFGTGYSSFNNLKHLPVNFLKTERDFIQGIEDDSYMKYFFFIMAEIAHANGMKLIAEGIETRDQLNIVKNNGADYIQGYFFSRPLPAGELTNHIASFHAPVHYFPLRSEVIDIKQWLNGKNAYEVTPHLFKLLNHCMQILLLNSNTPAAFQEVLEAAGEHFGVSRAFAFIRIAGNIYSNLYEWCAKGSAPHKHFLQNIDVRKNTLSLLEALHNAGMIVASDISKLPPDIYGELSPLDIRAVALVPIWDEAGLEGFVGFDRPDYHDWSPEELVMLWNLAMIMSGALKRVKLQNEVEEKSTVLSSVFRHTGLCAYVSDLDTYEILWANDAMRALHPAASFQPGRACYTTLYGREAPCPECNIDILAASPDPTQMVREVYDESLQRTLLIYESLIPWAGGKRAHIAYALDITDRKKTEKQILYLASTDLQTGVNNKAAIMVQLRSLVKQAESGGEHFSMAFLNINNTGRINSAHGYETGDQVFLYVVKAVRGSIRSRDSIGRLGGDEFLVLLPGCSKATARVRMLEAKNALAQIQALPDGDAISFCYGLVENTEAPGTDAAGLVAIAGKRLREQKGRDRRSTLDPVFSGRRSGSE